MLTRLSLIDRLPHSIRRHPRLIAALWCLALSVYVLAGLSITSFHGDEINHMRNSADYWTLFVDRNPAGVRVPAEINIWQERDGYYRLLDSTVARYAIGLSLHLAGFTVTALPPDTYMFGQTHEVNQNFGVIPPQAVFDAARLASALFFCVSIGIFFALAHRVGGWRVAYLSSLLYAVNPILLLNNRRALQEGSLLCFGLATVYVAALIAVKRERGEPTRPIHWAGLAVLAALTQASKNNGFLFILIAFLWIAVAEIVARRWSWATVGRRLAGIMGVALRLMACGVLTLLLFYILSPGLWADPYMRGRDMIEVRMEAMVQQIDLDPAAPTTLERRLIDALAITFIAPVAHYEFVTGPPSETLIDQYVRYNQSWLSGWHSGLGAGGLLMLCALIGLIGVLAWAAAGRVPRSAAAGLWIMLTVNLVFLLQIALPWQRYAIPWIPGVILSASVGVPIAAGWLARLVRVPNDRAPAPTVNDEGAS